MVVLTVDSLVQQLNVSLGLVRLMVLVLLNCLQHLHLLVILTGSHSDLLVLEIYSLLVDLSNLLQLILQNVPFCSLDQVLHLRNRQTDISDLEIYLLLVELQRQLQSTKQQQVSLQYLVLVSRNKLMIILDLVLQLYLVPNRESNSRLYWRYCSVYSIWKCSRETD